MKSVGLKMMVLAGVLSTPAMACDLCSVYSVAQARGESGSGIFAAVAGQFTHFGTVQQDGVKQANVAEQRLDSYITQIVAGYNFNDRLGVQVNLPWIERSYKRPDGLAIEQGNVRGIGDISLLGRLALVTLEEEKTTLRWQLQGGVKLPTGSSKRIYEEVLELTAPPPPPGAIDSGIHGHDLALGTGSVDGIVGTSIYARWSKLFLTVNAQ
ncbi:MAG TPA: hypothetical protein VK968_05940, partial [Roseimicrobium sp.]|nr:hypothetical protein [Roseimicrobium sp.]